MWSVIFVLWLIAQIKILKHPEAKPIEDHYINKNIISNTWISAKKVQLLQKTEGIKPHGSTNL